MSNEQPKRDGWWYDALRDEQLIDPPFPTPTMRDHLRSLRQMAPLLSTLAIAYALLTALLILSGCGPSDRGMWDRIRTDAWSAGQGN